MKKRILSLLLSVLLAISLFSGSIPETAAASSGSCILQNEELLPAGGGWTLNVGEHTELDLTRLFTDRGGHTLTYDFSVSDGAGKEYASPQIHISDSESSSGIFTFSTPDAGSYTVTVYARCRETGEQASAVIRAEVAAVKDGLPVQYGYDETPAGSVTVFATVSSDGIPLLGNDVEETVLAHLQVTVPYFDLGLYDLQCYYRYPTKDGSYVGDTVIERPTAMHLFIYLIERYYLGLPESECGKGKSDVLDGPGDCGVFNMLGEEAYDDREFSSLSYSGNACSSYMQQAWGHDENLMYYRNHAYPLQRAGWGSTSDYILLSDGDTIDLAMFTDWGFYQNGSFCTFVDRDTSVNDGQTNDNHTDINYRPGSAFTAVVGENKTISAVRFGTQSIAAGGTDCFEPIATNGYTAGLCIGVYDENWNEITGNAELVTEWNCDGGICTMTFARPGTYYLLGMDQNAGINEDGTSNACIAPATAKIIVTESGAAPTEPEILLGDVDGDGDITNVDVRLARNAVLKKTTLSEEARLAADVDGDGDLTNVDVRLLRNYVLKKISSFD